jgi:hypothetical protein
MATLHNGAILPELLTLCYLVVGSYTDIQLMCGIYESSFYQVVWKTIMAICTSSSSFLTIKSPQSLDEVKDAATRFQTICQQGCLWNCVSVIDGHPLQIQTPSKKEAKKVKYFSGHYKHTWS